MAHLLLWSASRERHLTRASQVGDQVAHLVLLQGIEQPVGHDRKGGWFAGVEVGAGRGTRADRDEDG